MNIAHHIVLFFALVGFIYQALQSFGQYLPFELTRTAHKAHIYALQLVFARVSWLIIAGQIGQVIVILGFIKLGWFSVAGLSVGFLLMLEISIWEAKGHKFIAH